MLALAMLVLVLLARQSPPPETPSPQTPPPQTPAQPPPSSPAQTPKLSGSLNEVVAVVGPEAITRREWSEAVAARALVPDATEDERAILRDLVERRLMRLKAKDLGVTVSDQEVNEYTERWENWAKNNKGGGLDGTEAFDSFLKERGLTREQWQVQAKDDLITRKLQQMRPDLARDSDPTPRDLRNAYRALKNGPLFTQRGSVSLGSLRVSKSELGLEEAAKTILEMHRRAVNGETLENIAKTAPAGVTYATIPAQSARDEFKSFMGSNPKVGAVSTPIDLGPLIVIVCVDKITPTQVLPFENQKTQEMLVEVMTRRKRDEVRHRYVESVRGEYVVWPASLFDK